MSFSDDPDHEDQTPQRRHRTTGWRPAWDAATYGRPDDVRLRRPPDIDPREDHVDPNPGGDTGTHSQQGDAGWGGGQFGDPSWSDSASSRWPGPSEPEAPSWTEPPRRPDTQPWSQTHDTSRSHSWGAEIRRGPQSDDNDQRYPGGIGGDDRTYPGGVGTPPDFRPASYPDPRPGSYPRGTGSPVTPPASVPPGVSGGVAGSPVTPPARERPRRPHPAQASDAAAGHKQEPARRAGRNLPAAIGVGLLLAGLVLVTLLLWRPAFFGLIAVAVGVGVWELVRAIQASGVNPPLVPLVGGGLLMTGLAWWGETDALTFGLIVTVLAVMVWRLSDGPEGYGRDVTAATFIAVYLPFLAGFAALLAAPSDGDVRVLVTLAGVVLSDTGGYIAGVLFGRHPMAPSVSPKKTWEGLAGSLVATGAGGAVMLVLLFHTTVWVGVVFGVAVAAASVLGDLGESMIKRDLGVKDMSSLLPGHGGLMDRLDSVVFAAPTAYALLTILVPAQ